jgi:hypothetical protein
MPADSESTSHGTSYAAAARQQQKDGGTDGPAAQRRNLNSSARECREDAGNTDKVRFSGRHPWFEAERLPDTELVADRVIQLPFFNELRKKEIAEICSALKDATQGARRNT